jgi:hypothetical protein
MKFEKEIKSFIETDSKDYSILKVSNQEVFNKIKEFIKDKTFEYIQISRYSNLGLVIDRKIFKDKGKNYLCAIDLVPDSNRTTRIYIYDKKENKPLINFIEIEGQWNSLN